MFFLIALDNSQVCTLVPHPEKKSVVASVDISTSGTSSYLSN